MYNPNQSHPHPLWCVVVGFELEPRGLSMKSARTQARADRIRRLFVEQLGGKARLEDVRFAALQAGLLDTVPNAESQRQVVRSALSVIAEPIHPW